MGYVSGGTLQGVLRLSQPTTVPGLSAAGEGRVYYDSTLNKFQVSENGGAYVDLVGGGGAGSLSATLAIGNTTGGNDIVISNGDAITGETEINLQAGTNGVNGSDVDLVGGNATTGLGGRIVLTGGTGGTTGAGGDFVFVSGNGGSTSGSSGAVSLTSGTVTQGSTSGTVSIRTGSPVGTDDGGTSGAMTIGTGDAPYGTNNPGVSGDLTLQTGDATGNALTSAGGQASGNITIRTGTVNDTGGSAGNIEITAGGNSDGTNGTGGSVYITAGGGYSSGGIQISTEGDAGPSGGGEITIQRQLGAGNQEFLVNDNGLTFSVPGGQSFTFQSPTNLPTTTLLMDETDVTFTLPGTFTVDAADINMSTVSGGNTSIQFDYTDPDYPAGMFVLAPLGEAIYLGSGTIMVEANGGVNNRLRAKYAAAGSASAGEALRLSGGDGDGAGAGGLLTLDGGAAGATGTGGGVTIQGGTGGSTSGNAGDATLSGGVAIDGNGGSVSITGRNGAGTDRNGGNVSLQAGTATGTGTAGTVSLCTATTQLLRFYGTTAGTAQQTVTGSRGGNAALASLLTALAALGLIVDNTTA